MMCPYCGEELPDGAARCTRCQAELAEDAGGPPAEEMCPFCGSEVDPGLPRCPGCGTEITRGEDDDDDPGSPGGRVLHVVDCPRCETEVPAKRHRCPECGYLLKQLVSDSASASHQAMKLKAYAAIAGVLVVVVAVAFALGGPDEEEDREPVKVGFQSLYFTMSEGDNLKKADFKKKYHDRYVEWTGRLVRQSGDTLYLQHNTEETSIPDVKLVLEGSPDKELSQGDPVSYSGKVDLDRVPGPDAFFTLTNGTVK